MRDHNIAVETPKMQLYSLFTIIGILEGIKQYIRFTMMYDVNETLSNGCERMKCSNDPIKLKRIEMVFYGKSTNENEIEAEKFTTLVIQACGGNYMGETRFEKKVIIQMRTASLITKSHHHRDSRHL
ncbi:unnamed protein product [Lactuca virosa]|uniref:Uncharacterized protein n=1 Tax=Lactuca virosa TaxID=75947 RepID=A0AAU9P5W6_9ASTR|nr:unnamed protein product [Lactuca virosa]